MIECERRGTVAVLRIEHGKANAIDPELMAALGEELGKVLDSEARAAVLTGHGRIFSAGVDLFRLLDEGPSYPGDLLRSLSAELVKLLTMPLPLVAAVNGHAIAGGCVLACACDARVMMEGEGRIGVPELLVGLPFPAAALEIVRAACGAHGDRLVYRGQTYGAAEARELGLVDEVVPASALIERACALANSFGEVPQRTFAVAKRQLRLHLLESIERLGRAFDAEVIDIWSDEETRRQVRAYVEKTLKR